VPAYSPHTQGFPPTSHTASPLNPFSAKKVSGPATQAQGSPAKGNVQSVGSPTPTSACFLRPSKLEAGLGSNIFSKHSPYTNAIEPQLKEAEEAEDVNRNTTLNSPVDGNARAEEETAGKGNALKEPAVDEAREENIIEPVTTTGDEPATGTATVTEEPKEKDKTNSPTTMEDEAKKEILGFNAPPVGFLFGSNLNDRVEVRKFLLIPN